MAVFFTSGRPRQEGYEFKASLNYTTKTLLQETGKKERGKKTGRKFAGVFSVAELNAITPKQLGGGRVHFTLPVPPLMFASSTGVLDLDGHLCVYAWVGRLVGILLTAWLSGVWLSPSA